MVGLLALAAPAATLAAEIPPPTRVKLYALDCGLLEFSNLAPFADTGHYDGRPGVFRASCFLVRHPDGDLLWDAGLGDEIADSPEGVSRADYRAIVHQTMADQLQRIGMTYADIELFAFSHGHADHLGNAGRLSQATWIMNRRELEWIEGAPTPPRVNPGMLSSRTDSRTRFVEGDHDVFGDGTVRIISIPGHSPGHQALLVALATRPPVLISGDIYHSHENRHERRMPVFNVDRADTLASMERVEGLLAASRATLIIQHSVEDFSALPRPPSYFE